MNQKKSLFSISIFVFGLSATLLAQTNKPIYQSNAFNVSRTQVVQGKYRATALSATEIESNYQGQQTPTAATTKRWKLKKDISAFPQLNTPNLLENAIYNMSVEEMEKAIEKDSTLRTGIEWPGVWTRDVSYSIILSMAYMQPRVSQNSLMRKVNGNGRIIQDTGTGGAWPASTDRMIWAVAAWEIYKVTGDMNWLKKVYPIIRNSIEDDIMVDHDDETGLVKGESSFLDWREQNYPRWMQPVDIFESKNLGTNALHYQALTVAGKMAGLLDDKQISNKYTQLAADLKGSINKQLWIPGK